MASETLPNQGLPHVAIASPNKYTPDFWVNKPHPLFGFLEVQARDGVQRGWLQFMPPQGFIIFGRDLGAAHIFVGHPSISNQHAVAAWDVRDGKCYILDLESEHGTFVNDQVIEHSVPYELRPGARVRFGQSAHIYMFNKLPEELVDPNQEAPVVERNRGMDAMTEASQPRYDDRFPEPPPEFEHPSHFHGDRPPSDRDRRVPPQDVDRRGPPSEIDRRGPLSDMDRRGPPLERDRRGPRPEMDPRGPSPNMDRRGPPLNIDRHGPPHEMDRRGPLPDMDRRGPLPETWSPRNRHYDERRPEGQGHGPSPRYDDRGRFDGPPRTPPPPPPHMGQGPRFQQHGGRSPRMGGRGSPRLRRGRTPQRHEFR